MSADLISVCSRPAGSAQDVQKHRASLRTGVELDVWTAGNRSTPAIMFLHGFPDSHRIWGRQLERFSADHFVIAPDQRGFAASSKPEGADSYSHEARVADVLALAEHFGIERFTLVGHDWGGIIAWIVAAQHSEALNSLIIINAPHPTLFQRSLLSSPAQRAASQYIRAFQSDGFEREIEAIGLERFFERIFGRHLPANVIAGEKQAYLEEWRQPGALKGMLNWYRGSSIRVPAPEDDLSLSQGVLLPKILLVPTLVVWGMKDTALLPCQIESLDEFVADLTVLRIQDAGHFVPWEQPRRINLAIQTWLMSVSEELGARL